MKQRFSKATVREMLCVIGNHAAKEFDNLTGRPVDPRNGYSQVPKGNDAAQRAYSRYDTCRNIMDALYLHE